MENLEETFTILPLVKELMEEIKESTSTAKYGASSEKARILKQKYDKAFTTLDELPGIQLSIEEQAELIEHLKAQVDQKRKTVASYKENLFNGDK